ncbi:hypothetical protein NDU88_000532 [Pleurodeles waltl]|uniref:Uncharacterized protein n=1 Tax=Pleurodeles waltl TaxID=8319 RepID=A0AAV7WLN2_PLEWA|nr:hypothetical protein NDU88_000532 [Pleurodeles waltl]
MGPRILIYSLAITLSILESSYSGPVAIYRFNREVNCKSSAANLKDAIMSVTKAEDVRLETELMMKPYANWEEFLMPAPISIAILGELAAISSAQGDFSINLNPPKDGFKYMKYPESFSASLMQVCNKAWGSFSTANKNMDQIRLLTGSMPSATKEIVTILFQNTETVNALLPQRLSRFLTVSNECISLAQSVEISFSETIHLIQEVLEACLNSKKGYEKKLTDVKIALEQLTIREASANKSVQMAEEFRKSTETQLKDASDVYKDALKKVPSVWETMAANFVGGLLDTLSFTVNRVISKELGTDIPASGAVGTVSDAGTGDVRSTQATNNICSKSNQMTAITEGLRKVIDSNGETINMKIVYDEREQTVSTNYVQRLILSLKKDIADEVECKAQTIMDGVLQSGIAICEDLERAALSKNTDNKQLKSIAERINSLFSSSLKVDSYCKSVTYSQPLQQKPPNAARAQGGGGMGTQSAQMAQARVEQATLQLDKTQKMYKESFENLQKENEKLTLILVEMRSHKLEQIDFDTAKNMLIKGLDALGRVKEQWEKMIRFFQMISNLINSCLGKNVNELVQSVKSVQSIPNYSSDAFVKDMLYNQAFKASNVANLVNMISSTYCEVSQRYLMDRVSALGRLLTMNPSNPAFQIEREKLQSGCAEAQKSIQDLVISKKQDFDMNIEARVDAINCQLGAAIPPMSTAEKKSISEAVKAGTSAVGDSGDTNLDISSFV